MKYDPHQTQKDIKKQNKGIILTILAESPKRFTDLQKDTKFSPTGLTSILKRLIDEEEIEKTTLDGKSAYAITELGKIIFERGKIAHILNMIEKNDGVFDYSYSGVSEVLEPHRLMGGIYPYLVMDKNLDKLNLLSPSDIMDIEKFVLEKFIKKKNRLQQENSGQLVFGFVMDYPKLLNTIKKDPKEIAENFTNMLKILYQKYVQPNKKEIKKQQKKFESREKKRLKHQTRKKK